MGVSAAQFKSAGQSTQHYIPGVYSRRNNVSAGSGVSTGNLCILGTSMGGEPRKLLKFGSLADAKEILVSGELLDGVAHAFNGSNTYIPQYVYAMRVNNGTKSKAEFKIGGDVVITAKSADFGSQTNQIKKWLDDGTDGGKKITVVYKNNECFVDNIERESFSIMYAGSGTRATCTIGKGGLTLSSDVEEEKLTVSFDDAETLDTLIARINDTGFYSAQVIDKSENAPTKELDHVSGVEIGDSAVVFKSDVQALADALKSINVIGEVEIGANRVMPENDTGYVYFSGAEAGTSTVADYIETLELLEREDVQILATPSTNKNVHSLISDHCVSMSTVSKKRERTFIVGTPSKTSIAEGLKEAKGLNTELGSVIITNANANNPLTGMAEEISPALLACKVAGIEVAMTPSVPLTNKTIKVNSFGMKYKDTELEEMIAGGIMPFGENENGELVCIRGMTCYQGDNLVMNERSMIRSALFMDRDLRKANGRRTGTNDEPSESSIVQVLENKARGWYRDSLITKSDDGKLVFNISVRFDGDKTYLSFDRFIRAPNNFMFITSTNRVYSSTVEV